MKTRYAKQIYDFTQWVNLRDSAQTEGLLGFVMFCIGLRILTGGAPVASGALINVAGHGWGWFLMLLGVIKTLALIHGLRTGNSYKFRSWVSLFASFVWVAIVIGVLSSTSDPLSAGIYVGFTIASYSATIVLMVRSEIRKNSAKPVQLRTHHADESEIHVLEERRIKGV